MKPLFVQILCKLLVTFCFILATYGRPLFPHYHHHWRPTWSKATPRQGRLPELLQLIRAFTGSTPNFFDVSAGLGVFANAFYTNRISNRLSEVESSLGSASSSQASDIAQIKADLAQLKTDFATSQASQATANVRVQELCAAVKLIYQSLNTDHGIAVRTQDASNTDITDFNCS